MKIISLTMAILIGLLLLGAIGYAGIVAVEYIGTLYMSLEPQVARVTMIASIVAVFCALMIASGLKAGSPNSVPVEKINLYQRLLALWSERLNGSVGGEEQGAGKLIGLEQHLALHGSPKVIAAYMNLRRSAGQDEETGDEAHDMLKQLLMEMRADIGRTEFNLKKRDTLDLLLGRH